MGNSGLLFQFQPQRAFFFCLENILAKHLIINIKILLICFRKWRNFGFFSNHELSPRVSNIAAHVKYRVDIFSRSVTRTLLFQERTQKLYI